MSRRKLLCKLVSGAMAAIFAVQTFPLWVMAHDSDNETVLDIPQGYEFDIPRESAVEKRVTYLPTFVDEGAPGDTGLTDEEIQTDGTLDISEAAETNDAGSGEEEADQFNLSQSYIGAPYVYNYSDAESIQLNTGSLVYKCVDYIFPGVNGLDLVIGRVYNSNDANVYKYDENLYRTNIGGYNVKNNSFFVDTYGLGYGWSFMFPSMEEGTNGTKGVLIHMSDGTVFDSGDTENYPDIVESFSNKDYELCSDCILCSDCDCCLNTPSGKCTDCDGDECDCYHCTSCPYRFVCSTITYRDGTRDFFNYGGRIIIRRDRFGNEIFFDYIEETINNKDEIVGMTITDTVGREIEITKGSGGVTVSYLNDTIIEYETTENVEGDNEIKTLTGVTDAAGNETLYSYLISTAPTSFFSKPGYDGDVEEPVTGNNKYALLYGITYPTGGQSVYEYEEVERNLGEDGLITASRIKKRYDLINGEVKNVSNITYSPNDYTGYPQYENPYASHEYYTEVSNADGLITKSVFQTATYTIPNSGSAENDYEDDKYTESQNTKVEMYSGDVKYREIFYEYGGRGQKPIKTTTKYYTPTNQAFPLTTVEVCEYDGAGNISASWSPLAEGDKSDTRYKTSYTYGKYNQLLTKTYKTDVDTEISIRNTLDSAEKSIVSSGVYVNNVLKSKTEFEYNENGELTTKKIYRDNLTDFDTVSYTYTNGLVTCENHTGVENSDGEAALSTPGKGNGTISASYTYDAYGNLITSTDGRRNTTSYTYDDIGNITGFTNPDNTTVTYVRNYAANTLTVTDENGNSVKYTYNAVGLEYETIDTETGYVISRKEYDEMSRLSRKINFIYGTDTEYTYDILGRPESETVRQNGEIISQILTYYDDAAGFTADGAAYSKVINVTVGDETSPSTVTTKYLDKAGNTIKTGVFLDGTEYINTYEYDYAGNLVKELTAGDAARELEYTAKYEYNENGQVVRTYNSAGQYTENEYDLAGGLITATDYEGTPTEYTYDAMGRMLTQKVKIDTGEYSTVKYDYDANGNLIRERKQTNACGESAAWTKTEYAYDVRNRLRTVSQYDGDEIDSITKYTYDGVGNTLTVTAGLLSENSTLGHTTSYTYDRFGNVLSVTDPMGMTESYTYSALGRPVTKTDRKGTTTTYAYDMLGRVVGTSAVLGESTEIMRYSYSKNGKLKSEESPTDRTEYKYDGLGRLLRATDTALESANTEPLPPTYTEPTQYYYTVTFNANGGSVDDEEITVPILDTFTFPTPTKTGYTFECWVNGEDEYEAGESFEPESDMVFTARWHANTYKLIYKGDGGSTSDGKTEVEQLCIYDQPVTIISNPFTNAPTRNMLGQTQSGVFTKWKIGTSEYDAGTVVSENLGTDQDGETTVNAQWTYPINFSGGLYAEEDESLFTFGDENLYESTEINDTQETEITYYVWEKYESVLSYYVTLGDEYSSEDECLNKYTYTGYEFDQDGEIVLTGMSSTRSENFTGYFTEGGEVCYGTSYNLNGEEGYSYNVLEVGSQYVRGNSVLGIETSANSVEYPENGKLGSYWYVKLAETHTEYVPENDNDTPVYYIWDLYNLKQLYKVVYTDGGADSGDYLYEFYYSDFNVTYNGGIVLTGKSDAKSRNFNGYFYEGEEPCSGYSYYSDDENCHYSYEYMSTEPDGMGCGETLVQTVLSTNPDAYPEDGQMGSLWYKKRGEPQPPSASEVSIPEEYITETDYDGLYNFSAGTRTTVYRYDINGNRTEMTAAEGTVTVQEITYTYDTQNRLSSVSEGESLKASYTYDINGNRASLTLGNGVTTTYGYNKANWVTSLTNAKEGALISSYSYTYYASGNRKSESDNTGKVTSYTYDGVGRLVSESKAGESITYTYDRFGNRASMTVSGSDGYTTTYAYDANNRLTSEIKDNVTTTYTYDNNGNNISKSCGTSLDVYSYNLYNQLTGNVINNVNATYTYNAKGIRTSKTVGTDVTSFILDGGNVIAEVKGTAVTDYVRGINLICTDESYYLYNAHGDVVSLTSTSGVVTKTYEYDAFGNEANPSSTDTNPFRYCGEYFDTETGTYYLRARYYDPSLGRFGTEDPAYDGLNWYTYCLGNPVLFVDPSGCIGVLPDGSIYMSEKDTEIDRQLLIYKIEYEKATTQEEKNRIAREARLLREANVDKYHVQADISLEYYMIVNIDEQLNSLMEYESEEYSQYYDLPLSKKLKTFYLLVRNKGIYDLKNQPEWQHEHFIYDDEIVDKDVPGNINYGYLGKTMGFGDLILYAGAGFAQIRSGNSEISFAFSWFDDPRDQKRIKQGIQKYKQENRGLFGIYWGK